MMPTEVSRFVSDVSAPAALPTVTGNILCGVEYVTGTVAVTSGKVPTDPVPFYADLNPPGEATMAVAALTGFQMAYQDTSYHIQAEAVSLDVFPQSGSLPKRLTGSIRFTDDMGRWWTGSVSAVVLYFQPYWA